MPGIQWDVKVNYFILALKNENKVVGVKKCVVLIYYEGSESNTKDNLMAQESDKYQYHKDDQ
jgi:hypothetical protein